jgi:phosphoglycerate kinase
VSEAARIPILENLLPLDGKRVLVRTDFNVPMREEDGQWVIADDFRIRATLPTLEYLLANGAEVTVITHLGRPEGHYDERYDLGPLRERLDELCPGVELGENLRFSPGELSNDPAFVETLIKGQDCYVNDAFGVSHRAHASIVGPPAFLPSAAGRLLQREVEVLSSLLTRPERPFVAIVGGAKIGDKLGVLRSLATHVDTLLVGGGLSYTFLAALGHSIGDSLFDPQHTDDCEKLLASDTEVIVPTDVVALLADGETVEVVTDVPDGAKALDIGPATQARFAEVIAGARTVLWNGPMGVFEDPRFVAGTRAVADALAACTGFTVVGGGDSAAAIDEFELADAIDWVSTGGGASLELIEYGDLPGLAALRSAPNARTHSSA